MNLLRYSLVAGMALVQLILVYPVSAQLFRKSFTATDVQTSDKNSEVLRLNDSINAILADTGIPGLSFALIDSGKVVFYNAYGYKDFEKKTLVDKNSVFEACSMSKTFFVYAVHKLVDSGLLDLDKPLYEYMEYPRLSHDDRYKKITARMILSHSSGLENWQSYNNPDLLEIVSEPGSAFVYSGEGYVYLSKALENILGKNTDEYMQELVYNPLGLTRTFTYFQEREDKTVIPSNYSIGHNIFRETLPKKLNTEPAIASNISTTAEDYAKLLVAMFDGKHLSESRIYDLTRTGISTDSDSYISLGLAVYINKSDTVVYQSGDNGDFKGIGFYSINSKSGYVMLSNSEMADNIRRVLDNLTFRHGIFDAEGQYPNLSFTLLNAYNEKGLTSAEDVFYQIMKSDTVLSEDSFISAVNLFAGRELGLSKKIADALLQMYPSNPTAYITYGRLEMRNQKYFEALKYFHEAKKVEEGSTKYIDDLIAECRQLSMNEE